MADPTQARPPIGRTTLKYLARAWVRPLPEASGLRFAGRVAELLGVDDLVVTQVQRLAAPSNRMMSGRMMSGHQLSSTDGWMVYVVHDSIDLIHQPHIDPAVRSLSAAEFMQKASALLADLVGESKCSRLASMAEVMLPEMSEEELEKTAKALLRFPDLFGPAPWEWEWRCVATVPRRFGDHQEPTNTAAKVQRAKGRVGEGPEFDRVHANFDINTDASNATPRFAAEGVRAFLSEASSWLTELEHSLTAFIEEGTK